MPELPEVETVKRDLQSLIGLQISQVNLIHQLRLPYAPNLSADLLGQTITAITRRGKYLLFQLSSQATLVIHLGMTGNLFHLIDATTVAQLSHVHFSLALVSPHDLSAQEKEQEAINYLVFNDPRRFGMVLWQPAGTLLPALAKLGVEPLSSDFSATYLKHCCAKKTTPIKNLLLNQELIAGIGNIYACEALFASQVSPIRSAKNLKATELSKLCLTIGNILRSSIRAGGTSFRDYRHPDGHQGNFVAHLQVYGRAGLPCVVCQNQIKRIVQAGRSTFYCPHCQR